MTCSITSLLSYDYSIDLLPLNDFPRCFTKFPEHYCYHKLCQCDDVMNDLDKNMKLLFFSCTLID